jgi:hypothetical protein
MVLSKALLAAGLIRSVKSRGRIMGRETKKKKKEKVRERKEERRARRGPSSG